MTMCIQGVTGAYEDNKRETLNSLLRVQTPFPERSKCEEIVVKTVSCACFPLKCLEGLGMITCGAILWPIPCTICQIETEHQETDVSIKKIYPSFRKPNIPCHYEDSSHSGNQVISNEGYSISCSFGKRPKGEQPLVNAESSLTGYNCLSSGVGKIVNTVLSTICCPISTASLACSSN
jgi:hypothetical protein